MHGYNDNTRCIYFELMEQSLDANKIDRGRTKYHVATIREMIHRTLCGLKVIHDSGINHCDLHLGNILVGRDGLTSIADLGLCRQIGTVYQQSAGEINIVAPETAHGRHVASHKSDFYSCGISIFNFASSKRVRQPARQFIEANLPIEIELTYGRDLSDLILLLTETNPEHRLTDHSIALQHPFLEARNTDEWMDKRIQIREPLNLMQQMAEMVGDMILTESSDDEDEEDDEVEESVRPPRIYGKPTALKKSLRVRMTNLGTFILTETVNGVTIDLMRGGHRTGDTEEFRCADCDRRIFIATANKNWRFVRQIGQHTNQCEQH